MRRLPFNVAGIIPSIAAITAFIAGDTRRGIELVQTVILIEVEK